MRNPANGILGNAQLLQDTSLSAEQRDLMNDLIASVEQMGNVLNNVLGACPSPLFALLSTGIAHGCTAQT